MDIESYFEKFPQIKIHLNKNHVSQSNCPSHSTGAIPTFRAKLQLPL